MGQFKTPSHLYAAVPLAAWAVALGSRPDARIGG